MLDFNAAIHHDFEAGSPRPLGGFFMNHAELHPDHLSASGDGLVHDLGDGGGLAENVDNLYVARYSRSDA